MSRRLGLFGGTFDPVHHGHLIVVQEAAAILSLDHVQFIPTRIPPHKPGPTASDSLRVQMLQAALEPHNNFSVNELELRREPPSYTIDTIRSLQQDLEANEKLYFLAGLDSVTALDEWKEYKNLLEKVQVVGLSRPGHDPENIPRNIRDEIKLISTPSVDVSSSLIRQRRGQSKPYRAFVPESVAEIIHREDLYRSS